MVGRSTNETWLGSLLPGPAAPASATPRRGLTEVPERIGPYEVEELVGRGGMAAVYRCRDEAGETVAVKWLHAPSEAIQARFEREIRSLSRLDHPGVVRFLGQGSHRGRPYLVMEFLPGEDLRLWTHRSKRLPAVERRRRVRRLAERLAESLSYLHGRGLVHRDVKPSNVLVLEQDFPVLTDFGVVKELDDDGETAMGVVVGTLNYASPEQLRGEPVDARTDLYGFGCTLYYMLTGRVPFELAQQAELVLAHLTRSPTPPSHHDPTISADLEQVVLRLMAKDPGERYASAREVAAALSATPTPAGVPLAGREQALSRIAKALERVASGQGCCVRVTGRKGTGKTWAIRTLQEGAARRCLPYLEPHEPPALEAARERLSAGEALLVVTELSIAEPDLHLHLEPLGRADLRRSVVAVAPLARDPAALAERLFRATGGLPVLLMPLLGQLVADAAALDGELPLIEVESWLDGLDLDELEVLQALAASPAPLTADQLEAITQIPADEPLAALREAGLVVAVARGRRVVPGIARGRRYTVAAGAFVQGALELAPEPEVLQAKAEAILGSGSDRPPQPALSHAHELLATGALDEAAREIEALEGGEAAQRQPVGLLLGRARLHWLAGRIDMARESFEQARIRAKAPSRGGATALLGLAVIDQQLGQPLAAVDWLDKAALDAHAGGHLDLETMAMIQASWGRALTGRPGPALRTAVKQVGFARALGDPALECIAMELQGRLLLEVGLPRDAARRLADISALSHAAGLPRERFQAHVLRARASLDEDTTSHTGAAAATERLLRVLGERGPPDPLNFRGLAYALLARASARLADARSYRLACSRAERQLADGQGPIAIIARLQLVRAFWVSAERQRSRDLLDTIARDAAERGYGFLAWQARRLRAALRGGEPESASALLEGMEPQWAEAMTREPEPR